MPMTKRQVRERDAASAEFTRHKREEHALDLAVLLLLSIILFILWYIAPCVQG